MFKIVINDLTTKCYEEYIIYMININYIDNCGTAKC